MAQVVFAIITGIVPALFWLWFWLHEDSAKPEPKALIGEIFVLGGLAVIPAFYLEQWLGAGEPLPTTLTGLLLVITLWATVEEGLKFIAVYLGGLRLSFYDEPVDAMIYMVTAALGFAAIENTLFILGALNDLGGVHYILTGNFRFLGATLVHVVCSAIIGGVIGLAFKQSRLKRASYFTVGFIAACMLHALFNYFIITTNSDLIFIIFGVLWLAGVLIIFLFERVKDSIIEKHFTPS